MEPTRINLSAHKDKHQDETWNQSSVLMGLLKGTLKVASFTLGATANLMVLTGKGFKKIGVILSKPKTDERGNYATMVTAFEEKEDGYWDKQKENW